MFGNALETYDVVLYGYFAALISPLFFPAENHITSSLAAMGVFAASFVMRPIGGIFFGHYGDKMGRRKALILSILLMTLPTTIIGVLPTYNEIGVIAPLTLILALLLQGLCAGGAYSGAAVFINEHARNGREGFAGSMLSTSGFLGATLVTGLGAFFTTSIMPDWAWRLPFLIGGIFGCIIFSLRNSLDESPVFLDISTEVENKHIPFIDILRGSKINMLCTMGIGGAAFIPFYSISIYMNLFMTTKLQMQSSNVLLINMSTMILWIFLLPIMGHLSDRIGKERLMSVASIATCIVSPVLFLPLMTKITLEDIFILQLVLSIVGAAFVAPSGALIPKLFKVKERCSGMSFSYFVGVALFGGTTPVIAGSLVELTGSPAAPAIYLVFGGLLGLISVKFAKRVS